MASRRPDETTILVIDDDAMMRTLVGRTLRGEGYQVWTASGALETRQVLNRIPGLLGHGIDLGREDLLAKRVRVTLP